MVRELISIVGWQGTCGVSRQCSSASDYGSPPCTCAIFTSPSYEFAFSTITKLCSMGKKIEERRSLGEEVRCMCDESYASEEWCGVP